MIECYYLQCPHHDAHHSHSEESELFCTLDFCVQSDETLEKWLKTTREEKFDEQ